MIEFANDPNRRTVVILSWSLNTYFVQRLYRGIKSSLDGQGLYLEVKELGHLNAEEYHAAIRDLADRSDLAGLIYGHLRLNVNQVARFKLRGIPVIACTERMQGIDWVTIDEVEGAYLATRYLLGLGHRRIAIINGPSVAFQSRQREEGFLRALAENGIGFSKEDDIRMLSFTEDDGKAAGHQLLDLASLPSAIFVAAGDVTALGVLHALRARGVRVPQNISVVGFDNLSFTNNLDPPLTTVNQPLEAMGGWAGQRMLQALRDPAGHKPKGEVFEAELVVRASATLADRTRPAPVQAERSI